MILGLLQTILACDKPISTTIVKIMDYTLSKYSFATNRAIGEKSFGLLFSGRTGQNTYVSKEAYDHIMSRNWSNLSKNTRDTLIKHKIIVPDTEDELESINQENREMLESQKEKPLYISLQPTAYCQLACVYCGQQHVNKHMTSEIIQTILARVSKKLDNGTFSGLRIGWFGGEPLCSLKNMRILNQGLKDIAEKHNLPYSGNLTTNGYMLSIDLYKELKEDFNINKIEITLDGDREHHDTHRMTCNGQGSFDKIFDNLMSVVTSDCYDKDKCLLSVRCNVDENNVDGVMPLLNLIVENEIQDKINFYTASVISWAHNGAGSDDARKRLGEATTEIFAFMIQNGFHVSVLPRRCPPFMCLGTDMDAEMYDAEGNIFDCSETSYSVYYVDKGLVLGNVMHDDTTHTKRSDINRIPSMLLNKEIQPCRECKFYPLCGGLCPLALMEGTPRCPSFIHNIEDLMFLDFLVKQRQKQAQKQQ